MPKKIQSDEVDIIEFIQVLWDNWIKIFFIVSTFVFLTIIYQVIYQNSQNKQGLKIFTTTAIDTISNLEAGKYDILNYYLIKVRDDQTIINKYNQNNKITEKNFIQLSTNKSNKKNNLIEKNPSKFFSLNFGPIYKSFLRDLFLNQLNEIEFIKSEIKKFNLIKRKNFNSIEDYNDAVNAMSLSFISGLTYAEGEQNNTPNLKPEINFKTYDVSEWKEFLENLEKSTNERVKNYLQDIFKDNILNLQKVAKYELEDIEMEILNAKNNYEKEMFNRVAFLKEQAIIARVLEISKNNNFNNNLMESQNFSTQNGIITTLKSEVPYYMRGYEMIEKEIDLIINRGDKEAFNNSLLELENKKAKLFQNKDHKRLQSIFEETPIKKSNNFSAANIKYELMQERVDQRKFDNNKNIFLAGIIGAIFAIFYVIIVNGIKKRIN